MQAVVDPQAQTQGGNSTSSSYNGSLAPPSNSANQFPVGMDRPDIRSLCKSLVSQVLAALRSNKKFQHSLEVAPWEEVGKGSMAASFHLSHLR